MSTDKLEENTSAGNESGNVESPTTIVSVDSNCCKYDIKSPIVLPAHFAKTKEPDGIG